AIAGPVLRDARDAASEVREAEHALLDAASAADETPAATVARLESRMYLGSQLLRDLDAMSMAHALEVRVPFVDHELASRVWPGLGRHPGLMRGKRLLPGTLARPVPAAALTHPNPGF